ncbi:MAG: nitrous oxide-stimulated promoter family protein [Muribaculaceae bacterium]
MDMTRIEKEKRVVELMIRLYCRKKEGNSVMCGECARLLEYACARLDRCPFGDGKGSCSRCRVHCYAPAMRGRIREVMRFSGPRMILYYPLEALRHMFK